LKSVKFHFGYRMMRFDSPNEIKYSKK